MSKKITEEAKAALIAKARANSSLIEAGPLSRDTSNDDPDYTYILPLIDQVKDFEKAGYEVVIGDQSIGDNTVTKPGQLGSAVEIKYLGAHHVLMRALNEVHAIRVDRINQKTQGFDAQLHRNDDKRLKVTYEKSPD